MDRAVGDSDNVSHGGGLGGVRGGGGGLGVRERDGGSRRTRTRGVRTLERRTTFVLKKRR